jgi:flotillin
LNSLGRKQQADVIAPAEADCQQAIAQAKGNAAKIIEDGKAKVSGIQELAASWQAAGSSAREMFLFQKLELLLKRKIQPKKNDESAT